MVDETVDQLHDEVIEDVTDVADVDKPIEHVILDAVNGNTEALKELTKIVGEMKNNSERDYKGVTFMFSLFDKEGKVLATDMIIISNFPSGDIKAFNAKAQVSRKKPIKGEIFTLVFANTPWEHV